MKNLFKYFISINIFIILLTASVFEPIAATIYNVDGYSYLTLTNSTAALCGWESDGSALAIPDRLVDHYITEIDDYAFYDNNEIIGLDLSNAVHLEKIGIMSFKNCTNLAGDITIPVRISSIGVAAFQGCSSLKNATIYSGAKTIPAQLFNSCSSIESITLGEGFTSIEKLAFANCPELQSVAIPRTVTNIRQSAFSNDNKVIIKGYRDSYALQFAKDNGIDYEILDPLYGDANEDGEVNIVDVTFIQKYRAGYDVSFKTKYGEKCADVNKDGQVTVRDATLIQMKLAKMNVDF